MTEQQKKECESIIFVALDAIPKSSGRSDWLRMTVMKLGAALGQDISFERADGILGECRRRGLLENQDSEPAYGGISVTVLRAVAGRIMRKKRYADCFHAVMDMLEKFC